MISFREALQPFLDLHGFWDHSLTLNKWVDSAAEARGDAFNQARWRHDRADMLNQQGKYHDAEQLYQQSEEQYRRLDQAEWALKSRYMRAMVVRAQGRTAEALHLCQTTLEGARELKLGTWLAHPLYVRALFLRDQGEVRRAAALVEESLALLADTQEYTMMRQCHTFLGEIALHQRRLSLARQHLETALQLVQLSAGVRQIVTTQRFLGDREGNDLDAEVFPLLLRALKIHQLLPAIRAPVSAIEEQDGPSPLQVPGKRHLTATHTRSSYSGKLLTIC